MTKNSRLDDESMNSPLHSLLLVGPLSTSCLVHLNEALTCQPVAPPADSSSEGSCASSTSSCWSADMRSGVIRGDVVVDGSNAKIEISALAGRQEYAAMHDSTYSECDAVLCLMEGGFKKDIADRIFEDCELVKDGKRFWFCLVLFGVATDSSISLKAEEWAQSHHNTTVEFLEDESFLAKVVSRVATDVHRGKAPLFSMHRAVGRGRSAPLSCIPRWMEPKKQVARPRSSECTIM